MTISRLVTDIRQHKSLQESDIIQQALAVLALRHHPGEFLTSPHDTAKYLQLKLSHCKAEVFGAIFLTIKNQVIDIRDLFQGTIGAATIHPRLILQHGLELNAAAVILYHNHPSGVDDPSDADIAITKKIKEALSLVDIRVIDHIIVTSCGTTSFAERGLL